MSPFLFNSKHNYPNILLKTSKIKIFLRSTLIMFNYTHKLHKIEYRLIWYELFSHKFIVDDSDVPNNKKTKSHMKRYFDCKKMHKLSSFVQSCLNVWCAENNFLIINDVVKITNFGLHDVGYLPDYCSLLLNLS